MPDCLRYEEPLHTAVHTGEISPEFAAHLAQCPACRNELDILTRALPGLQLLRAVAAPDPSAAVYARVAAPRRGWWAPVLVGAACVLLLAMLLVHRPIKQNTVAFHTGPTAPALPAVRATTMPETVQPRQIIPVPTRHPRIRKHPGRLRHAPVPKPLPVPNAPVLAKIPPSPAKEGRPLQVMVCFRVLVPVNDSSEVSDPTDPTYCAKPHTPRYVEKKCYRYLDVGQSFAGNHTPDDQQGGS